MRNDDEVIPPLFTGPPGEGWHYYQAAPPRSRDGGVIELWRREWGADTSFTRPREMNPETNIAGLWWRPA